ncbi:hypothetical protein ACIBEJ_34225 [Nonomuraea sp. NPDC050790]|uniref:hypothetical protein n=1 Tax=Nonomuraea sp. NPDC050790 TaxID=3364371 RepID=UPI00379AA9FE
MSFLYKILLRVSGGALVAALLGKASAAMSPVATVLFLVIGGAIALGAVLAIAALVRWAGAPPARPIIRNGGTRREHPAE